MPESSSPSDEFFQAGGTLGTNAPSYIERPADQAVLDILTAHELCIVIAPRQYGKSSLMERAALRLGERGVRSARVDLQSVDGLDFAEYLSDVVYQIERTLSLTVDSSRWWKDHSGIPASQRFRTFIEDVVLAEVSNDVVLFFDEVDSILKHDFSDYFFGTVRALHNSRASTPNVDRLSLVLLGVTTPADFTTDRSRTPFNVGTQVFLGDFVRDAIGPFEQVLGERGSEIVDRIFYWTSGQPFLVQQLAKAAYHLPAERRSAQEIDKEVRRTYFDCKLEANIHLKSIGTRLRGDVDDSLDGTLGVLQLYADVLRRISVPINDNDPHQLRLKLTGVVGEERGRLVPRNRIYERIFDLGWVRGYLDEGPSVLSSNPIIAAASEMLMLLSRVSFVTRELDLQAFREQVVEELKEFETRALKHGVPDRSVRAAHFVLCTAMDEKVLGASTSESIWATKGLLATFHAETTGGERFFHLLDRLRAEPARNVDLLELMYLCLLFGFQGQYQRSPAGRAALVDLTESLRAAIERQRGVVDELLSPNWRPVAFEPVVFQDMSLWKVAAIASVATIGAYVGFRFGIQASLNELWQIVLDG